MPEHDYPDCPECQSIIDELAEAIAEFQQSPIRHEEEQLYQVLMDASADGAESPGFEKALARFVFRPFIWSHEGTAGTNSFREFQRLAINQRHPKMRAVFGRIAAHGLESGHRIVPPRL